jgi:hypothetical protein
MDQEPETIYPESGPGFQWNLTRKIYLGENHIGTR